MDPGDGFAMDNEKAKKPSGLIGGDPPDPPPGSATECVRVSLGITPILYYNCVNIVNGLNRPHSYSHD